MAFELMQLYGSFAHEGKTHLEEWLPISNKNNLSFNVENNQTDIIVNISQFNTDRIAFWNQFVTEGNLLGKFLFSKNKNKL